MCRAHVRQTEDLVSLDLWAMAPGLIGGLAAFVAWVVLSHLWRRRRDRLAAEEFCGDEEIARLVAEHERHRSG